MTRTHKVLQGTLLLFAACIALPSAALTQSQAPPRAVSPGPYGVTVQSYETLATHTAYHPTDLSSWGAVKRLPIVSWGNGACARNGMAFAGFLTRQPGGGWFGEVAVAWLDYQLKSNADAAKWFVGPDCRLCQEPVRSVEKKGFGLN